jgi:hypothetical protein
MRAVLGNAGVAMLVVLPGEGWPPAAAWAAVLAGFGTFPFLAGAALVAGHAHENRPVAADGASPPSAPVRQEAGGP